MKSKRRNPYATVVRSAVFRQRVVKDKRRKRQDQQHRREMRERFSKYLFGCLLKRLSLGTTGTSPAWS